MEGKSKSARQGKLLIQFYKLKDELVIKFIFFSALVRPLYNCLLTPSELIPREECIAPNWEDIEDFCGMGYNGRLCLIDGGARYVQNL